MKERKKKQQVHLGVREAERNLWYDWIAAQQCIYTCI